MNHVILWIRYALMWRIVMDEIYIYLPKDHFKRHLFFSIFGWGDPSQLGSWSYGCVKPLKLSREAI